MFEVLSKAIIEAQEKDEEKIQRRKSKRASTRTEEFMNVAAGSDNDSRRSDDRAVIKELSISDIEEDEDDLLEDRDKWENNYICLVYMIALAVGGSNVWGFGFLCYKHGGIVFMVPYLFLTVVCALPCVYLELLIGQYAQVGAIAAWKLAPIFKGVGMCMILLSIMVCFNIQSVLAWCILYMFQAVFHHPLPWISCDNGFGKKPNGQHDESKVKWTEVHRDEEQGKNWHTENCTEFYADSGTDSILRENERLPGSEFFRGRVQRMWKSFYADTRFNSNQTNGEIQFGFDSPEKGILDYNNDTFICLIGVFILLVLCTGSGIRNAKLMVILTMSPYVILLMLFYRATGLNGAWDGLGALFEPDISKLFETETWWRCAEQVFYSSGAGFGMHLTCGSYNRFRHRVVYDAAIMVTVNAATSILSACTIFMFLGHVKVAVNREITEFVRSGPELIFEVMSDVLGVLANANFYAFSFYLFVFLIAFTTLITAKILLKIAYWEVFPVSVKYKMGSRIMIMILLQTLSFIASSLNLTRGGLHTYSFITTFTGLYSVVLCAFLFLIGIAWFFGLREIVDAAEEMGIRAPGVFFQVCWKFVSPIFLFIIFFGLLFDAKNLVVTFDDRIIHMDLGLYVVGYTIALGPILMVIAGAAHAIWKAPGNTFKEKMLTSISPTKEHNDILAQGTGKRAKFSHYFYLYARSPDEECNICRILQRKAKVGSELTEVKIKVEENDTSNPVERIKTDLLERQEGRISQSLSVHGDGNLRLSKVEESASKEPENTGQDQNKQTKRRSKDSDKHH